MHFLGNLGLGPPPWGPIIGLAARSRREAGQKGGRHPLFSPPNPNSLFYFSRAPPPSSSFVSFLCAALFLQTAPYRTSPLPIAPGRLLPTSAPASYRVVAFAACARAVSELNERRFAQSFGCGCFAVSVQAIKY